MSFCLVICKFRWGELTAGRIALQDVLQGLTLTSQQIG